VALTEEVLWSSPEEAARRTALGLLGQIREASRRVPGAGDEHALHDLRVAVRRLRSVLRAWRPELRGAIRKRHRKALRELQQATGTGRDAEVGRLWLAAQRPTLRPEHGPGLDWIERRLAERQASCQAKVGGELVEGLTRLADELEGRLAVLCVRRDLRRGVPEPVYAERLAELAAEAGAALAERLDATRTSAEAEVLHAARIAGKRLRYLIEPVSRLLPEARGIVERCKQLQDLLGEIQDAFVLGAELDRSLEASSVDRAARVRALAHEGFPERARREAWLIEWPGLLELMQRLRAWRDERVARLRSEWLASDRTAAALAGELAALVERLRELARPVQEIERKFLLHASPVLEGREIELLEIEQGWLPGERLQERLRCTRSQQATRYFRTVKLGRGARRLELEEETDAELFAALWPLTKGQRLRKRRYRVREGERVWDIDEFLDRPLLLAEVELPSEDAPLDLPAWLAPCITREVTGEWGFVGRELGQ
jgi:CHAD domain-containing protein/CYTH domain-containing protein